MSGMTTSILIAVELSDMVSKILLNKEDFAKQFDSGPLAGPCFHSALDSAQSRQVPGLVWLQTKSDFTGNSTVVTTDCDHPMGQKESQHSDRDPMHILQPFTGG
jgi:hypothetical protein